MSEVTEGKYAGEFIASEANGSRSREVETILAGQTLVAAQIVGKETASGKFAAFNQDAVDGTEAAAGISFANYDASAGDLEGVIIVRDAEVNGNDLLWPADIDAAEQLAAEAALAALGIIVRI
jgi:hypothetical protein